MRKLMLIGNLVKDSEVKNVSGSNLIHFSVCVNDKHTDKHGIKQDKAYYYECSLWRENTSISEKLKKGTEVYLEGTPELNTWTDKEGNTKASIRVRVDMVRYFGARSGNNQNNNTAQNSGTNSNRSSSMSPNTDFQNESKGHDDLPFK